MYIENAQGCNRGMKSCTLGLSQTQPTQNNRIREFTKIALMLDIFNALSDSLNDFPAVTAIQALVLESPCVIVT